MKPSRASNTAQVIAAATILLASDPRHAGEVAPGAAGLCEIFLCGSRGGRWLARSAAWPWTRQLWRLVERFTLPGIISHYWHRKRWIEAGCRGAIAEGFLRVVVLGAGFDTLAVRLAGEFPRIDFIEVVQFHVAVAGRDVRFPAPQPLDRALARLARRTVPLGGRSGGNVGISGGPRFRAVRNGADPGFHPARWHGAGGRKRGGVRTAPPIHKEWRAPGRLSAGACRQSDALSTALTAK